MKYYILSLWLSFSALSVSGQESYLYNGKKRINFKEDLNEKYVTLNSSNLTEFSKKGGLVSEVSKISIPYSIKKTSFSLDENHKYWSIIEGYNDLDIASNNSIQYSSPVYWIENQKVIISHYFYVKLKNENDVDKLYKIAEKFNVEVLGNDLFMPLWYILIVDKASLGNSVEISNEFFESGFFDFSEPDYILEYALDCQNDPLFPNQWNLKNTGQSGGTLGMDIAACEAWSITKGCQNIIVAIFDQGLEFNHSDFGTFTSSSFDAQSGTSPSH